MPSWQYPFKSQRTLSACTIQYSQPSSVPSEQTGAAAALRRDPLELPFGSLITYDLQGPDGALVGDDLTLLVAPAGDAPEGFLDEH